MKKLLLGSISLLVFSLSILLFQLSCKKDSTAQANNQTGLKQLNRILLYTRTPGGGAGKEELRLIDYEGRTWKSIEPIGLPLNYAYGSSKLSPDGAKIFITASDTTGGRYGGYAVFSMNIDGSGMTKIFETATNQMLGHMEEVY